ncbi:MAG: hypothetical protein AMS25_16195 [Gemmatimonas sp. SM23_52]|nr:MAG: hypothetical protein AMS25_16195 [Gemmatimonas sp. SM23_52]
MGRAHSRRCRLVASQKAPPSAWTGRWTSPPGRTGTSPAASGSRSRRRARPPASRPGFACSTTTRTSTSAFGRSTPGLTESLGASWSVTPSSDSPASGPAAAMTRSNSSSTPFTTVGTPTTSAPIPRASRWMG